MTLTSRLVLTLLPLVALGVTTPAAAGPEGPPVAAPDADDLIDGARTLDNRARRLESRAQASVGSAERQAIRAAELRQDCAADPSLRARAEELDVSVVSLRAAAARDREAASMLRRQATELRARAKVVAQHVSNAKKGRLNVVARSGCALEIDGIPRGNAPMVGLALAQGRHMVTCRVHGVPARTRSVDLVDGKPAHLAFEDAADVATIRPFL